jgi:hypothetical protein
MYSNSVRLAPINIKDDEDNDDDNDDESNK